jgi:hypothetical protein
MTQVRVDRVPRKDELGEIDGAEDGVRGRIKDRRGRTRRCRERVGEMLASDDERG